MTRLDDERAAHLLRAEARSLMGFVLMLCGEREAAEEVFQETCLEAWRHRSRFEPDQDYGAWLRGIARNAVLRFRRRAARTGARHQPLHHEAIDELESTWSWLQVADDPDARQRALRGCLEELGAPQRELLRQRYNEGASMEELARRSGRSADAVKMFFHRLRRRLFECVSRKLRREEVDASPSTR